MKLRIPELLREHGMTAYGLHKASGGRLSLSGAYRLARGEWKALSSEVLDVLCDVFGIDDPGPLFEREKRGKKSKS